MGCVTDANPTHKRPFFSFCVRFWPTQNGFFLVVSKENLERSESGSSSDSVGTSPSLPLRSKNDARKNINDGNTKQIL